jgi:hypothetical protein
VQSSPSRFAAGQGAFMNEAKHNDRNRTMDHGETMNSLADELKAKGAEMRDLLQRIEMQLDDQHSHAKETSDVDEMQRLQDADPYRWLADAKHSIQSGLMFGARAISQPTEF